MNHFVPPSTFGLAPRLVTLSYQSLLSIAASVDVMILLLASLLGSGSYEYFLTGQLMPTDGALGVGVMASILFVALARWRGLYRLQAVLDPMRQLKNLGLMLAVALLALTNILFLLKVGAHYSRVSMIAFAALPFPLLPARPFFVSPFSP